MIISTKEILTGSDVGDVGGDEGVSVERAWLQVEGACSEDDCV